MTQDTKPSTFNPQPIDSLINIHHKPNPPPHLPATTESSAKSSLAAGFARAIILNPLYFWFRSPLKIFRPTRVDYLDLARALLPPEKILRRPGQFLNFNTTTVGLLSHAVRKRGPKFISQYVVPPMLVNSLIGIVLFTTYDQLQPRLMPINPCFAPYFAGLMAGFAQSVIATPFDSVKIRMETQQLLDGRHRSMSAYYRWVFNKLGVSGAYRGFALTAFKDSMSFALFFGVFESSKKLMPTILPNRTQELDGSHRWYLALRSSTFVILSGMSAGLAFQTVDYPLEKIKTLLLIRAGRMELRRPPISRLYLKAYKQLALIAKVEGPAFFFRGFTSSLYKAIPATALGFACYEGLRNTLG